tara:strand:+ start:1066 stop:1638 length:573 start_codon:yes stop_codon:yes gene_type:complete
MHVFLDTETTGWPWEGAEIIELGIVDHEGNILFDERFRPRASTWPEAEKIHGISPADVENCKPFGFHAPAIAELLRNRIIIAYNSEFDEAALLQEFSVIGVSEDEIGIAKWLCAMSRFAPYWGNWNDYYQSYTWTNLSNAAHFCKHIWDGKAHSAVADCKATRTVWNWMDRQPVPTQGNISPPNGWKSNG